MTVLKLPIPPSANNLFPTGKHGKRFISPEYKAWLEQAGWELKGQALTKHTAEVSVTYEFARFTDKRRRDIGNFEKALSDLLVKQGVIRDDYLIQSITLAWSSAPAQGCVIATIEDWKD